MTPQTLLAVYSLFQSYLVFCRDITYLWGCSMPIATNAEGMKFAVQKKSKITAEIAKRLPSFSSYSAWYASDGKEVEWYHVTLF